NLYDFQFREQSPVQGRWLNPDPSDDSKQNDPQTFNRYSYVRNSAMGMVDPNGLQRNEKPRFLGYGMTGGAAGDSSYMEVPRWYEEEVLFGSLNQMSGPRSNGYASGLTWQGGGTDTEVSHKWEMAPSMAGAGGSWDV